MTNRSDFIGKPKRSTVDDDAQLLFWDPSDPLGEPFVADKAAFQAELSSRYAPSSDVHVSIEAATDRYLPVGIHAASRTVYARLDTATNMLFRCSEPTLSKWEYLALFSASSINVVSAVFVTASGAILAMANNTTDGFLYRSTNGQSWTQVLTGANLGTTRRSFCQLPNGAIFYGQYTTAGGTYSLSIYRSLDDGQTWTPVQTWANASSTISGPVRHIHFVVADPYVPNRVWFGTGDQNPQCFIAYSDNNLSTYTIIGQGDQTWRSVDLIFTEDAVWMADDNPDAAQYVRRWDRATQTRTVVSGDAGNSLYYGGVDSEDRMFWTSVFEGGAYQLQPVSQIITGRDNPDTKWQPRVVFGPRAGATRVEQFVFGPDADDAFVTGVINPAGYNSLYATLRFRLLDANAAADTPVPTGGLVRKDAVTRDWSTPGFDPRIAQTNAAGGTVGRVWCVRFVQPYDHLVDRILVRIGTQAGNLCTGFLDATGQQGRPVNRLISSGTVAVGAPGIQSVPIVPFLLRAGVQYNWFIQFDTTTGAAWSVDHALTASTSIASFTDEVFPMPATVAGSPAGTTRSYGAVFFKS